MPDFDTWISAVRHSHDRFTGLVTPLSEEDLTGPSYDTDWSVADVASHLGSQAEIFGLFLEAGLAGVPAPGGEVFPAIWDRWNALPPRDQVRGSGQANERFVSRLEGLSAVEQQSFAMSMFGQDVDLAGFAAMRLGEHALHTWDVAVALDPAARLSEDAVELLIDTAPQGAGRSGRPAGLDPVSVQTTSPSRRFVLHTAPSVALAVDSDGTAAELTIPAEALLRLISGRLDPDHTPPALAGNDVVARLREVFPGF